VPIIRNILRVQGGGAASAALLDFLADPQLGRGSVDLNQITPMPPWVFREATDMTMLEKYGEENCSRGWCLRHWGVSQNVLYPEQTAKLYDGGSVVRFDTEDKDVRELMRKLSLIFKDPYLDYLWASEDIGTSVGAVQYRDGETLIEFVPLPGTRAAVERSLDILGARASDYGLVYDPSGGGYVYQGGGDRYG